MCHFKSPRLHISIVQGLPVLKLKHGLSTRRPIGAGMCHFKSPRLHISIVQGLPVLRPKCGLSTMYLIR